MDVEGLGVTDVVASPNAVDEDVTGEYPSGILHQEQQQVELFERERFLAATYPYLVPVGIHANVAHLDWFGWVIDRRFSHDRRYVVRSPQNSPHSGDELP